MSVKSQALGVLLIASDGRGSTSIPVTRRFLARDRKTNIWYGFVINSASSNCLDCDSATKVEIMFLDEPGARKAFRLLEPIEIGDGIKVQGTLELESWTVN